MPPRRRAVKKPDPEPRLEPASNWIRLIAELDRLVIDTLRVMLSNSRDQFEKREIMKKLDNALDERLRLMAARDAAPST